MSQLKKGVMGYLITPVCPSSTALCVETRMGGVVVVGGGGGGNGGNGCVAFVEWLSTSSPCDIAGSGNVDVAASTGSLMLSSFLLLVYLSLSSSSLVRLRLLRTCDVVDIITNNIIYSACV